MVCIVYFFFKIHESKILPCKIQIVLELNQISKLFIFILKYLYLNALLWGHLTRILSWKKINVFKNNNSV